MFTHASLIGEMDYLRKFAVRLTKNTSNAEDLLQATMLRALEKKHLFQTGTDLFKWTSKIMFNLFISEYRRNARFETRYDPENFIKNRSEEAAQDIKLDFQKVGEAMARLSEDHRRILMLVCVQGQGYEEVSQQLGIPVGTVRSRLARARENLQTLLAKPRRRNRHIMPYRHLSWKNPMQSAA